MFRKTLILAICFSLRAFGCSYFPPAYKVSHSFTVHVKNEAGPVVGLKLKVFLFKYDEYQKLTDDEQRVTDPSSIRQRLAAAKVEVVLAEATTDRAGSAALNVSQSGAFTLSTETPFGPLNWVDIDVSDQPTSHVVELQWPKAAILKTQHVRGRLTKGLYTSSSVPLNGTALKLRSFTEYKEIAVTKTSEDGAFSFADVPQGLYFLEIIASSAPTDDFYKPEGNVAIQVSGDSQRKSLAISTANTSCGLSYDLEENKDRYKPQVCFKGGKQVKCDY